MRALGFSTLPFLSFWFTFHLLKTLPSVSPMGPALAPNLCLVYMALSNLSLTCPSSTTTQLTVLPILTTSSAMTFYPVSYSPNTPCTHTLMHTCTGTPTYTYAHTHTWALTCTLAHSPTHLSGLCLILSLRGRQPTHHSLHPRWEGAASHCTCPS